MLANILEYIKWGWPLFPVNPLNKRPLTENGFGAATRDEQQVREWWTKWPHAMIGLATGKVSGVVVLDVDYDPEKGINGREALAGYTSPESPLVATLCAMTPRKGLHFYFLCGEHDIRNSAGRLGRGLDVRGTGGYVILPPSMNSRRQEYKWVTTGRVPILPAPEWMVRKPKPNRTLSPIRLPNKGDAYVLAALREEARAVASASEGERNDQLNRSAFAMFRLVDECGVDAAVIHDVLLEAALRAGLTRGEIQATLLSARRARCG